MQRVFASRKCTLISLAIRLCLIAALSGIFLVTNRSLAAQASNAYTALPGSFTEAPAGAHFNGHHSGNAQLTVTLVLQPGNISSLNTLLKDLYTPGSPQFHRWLAKGNFNRRFAPSTSQVVQVKNFLKAAGLKIVATPTPFLERAVGTTVQIEAAFHTTINDYKAAGRAFFQNDTSAQIPVSLRSVVVAIAGLSNTARLHNHFITTHEVAQKAGKVTPRYGDGPDGSGLTPAQVSSIYGASSAYHLGDQGQGKGSTLAVFELSGYTPDDITTYEQQFFGASENVPLITINVDGGPVTPICPSGDQCGPFITDGTCDNGCDSADYTGDIEVAADVEVQIAVAPKADRVLVYNAPNDQLGITVVDEYAQIANDDLAASISSSWGACEQDMGLPITQAESTIFVQMAAQGQSVFSASGDTGAYSCLRGSGGTQLAVSDPASQPYVTGVGGTSFGYLYDPGSDPSPSYPDGSEEGWNSFNVCSVDFPDLCAYYGATGGGTSAFWGLPAYQNGLGVINSLSQQAPYCSQGVTGQYCREVPDVSANADPLTPYAEYCTGDPNTNSACAGSLFPGWFGIGGTSLSSPLWSAIIALWDSVHGKRFGLASSGLYLLLQSSNAYSLYFHDITSDNQDVTNNGYYPTTINYDMATGIGTPNISGIVKANF